MRFALPPISDFIRPRTAAAAVLAVGCIVTSVVNYPGILENDSFEQLLEGRRGRYAFWHPPVMSWLLGLSDWATPGAGIYVVVLTVLTFAALISLLWLVPRVSWAAVVGAVLFACLPQLFLFQATVWKDVLFADACLIGFVCLAHAAARWQKRRWRFAMLGLGAAFIALALLARQNGFVILPCAALALTIVAWRSDASARKAAVYGAGLLVVVAAAAFAGYAGLRTHSDGSNADRVLVKYLRLYDITGMVELRPDIKLTVLEKHSPRMARLVRTDGVRLFSPLMNDTLEYSAPLMEALDATTPEVVANQWRALILEHPGTYLTLRADLFRWVFSPPDVALCNPFQVGADGTAADLKALGTRPRMDNRDMALWRYANTFVHTPVFSHPVYALVALGALVFLLRRRRPADVAIAGLLAAVLLFTLSFFFISIACDYRYIYALDLAAIAAAFYILADPTKKGAREGPL